MLWIGIAITLLGFVLGVSSLGWTASLTGRLAMVLIGLALSLTGIVGIVNRAFVKNAIWRREHP
jgi:hypothetical protein